jgi:peptide/nickel transport system substrate-binding protein
VEAVGTPQLGVHLMARNPAWITAGLALLAMFGTGSSLSYYEEALPNTLNPLYAETMVDRRSQELVFDRLWFHDAIDNKLKSRIVDRYEIAEGGQALKIFLKPNIKWHNGKSLSSKDICFTVDALLDKRTASPLAEGYRQILAGCDTQGNMTALVRFTKVVHNPRERLEFAVLPQDSFKSTAITPDLEFGAHPVGTGPFKGSQGRRGVSFEAMGNAHHSPSLAQLRLSEGQDGSVLVRALINNGMQGIIAVPPPNRPELSASDEVTLKSYDLRSWWFIALNTNKGILKDKKVRQALNFMIDRTELRKFAIGVEEGAENSPCEIISGPFVQSSPYYNRSVRAVERANIVRAEQLLKSAGLSKASGSWTQNGAKVTLNIGMLATLNAEATDILDYIGNQLSEGGFDRQVDKVRADEWSQRVTTGNAQEFDLLIGKWSFGLVEDVNDQFHTRKGGEGKLNIFNYSNAEVDAILREYSAARTDTAAQDAYHNLHATLADDLPYLFLWKLDTRSAWRTEVRNNIIAPYYYFTEIDGWKYSK